jgi:lipopolysaccharide export system ATP-binding protein
LVRPDQGQVCLGGHDLGRSPLYARARRGLGYLPQEPTVFRGLSVLDNFLAVLEVVAPKLTAGERLARADALLSAYNLGVVRHSLARDLSGGERRRVEMARALIPEPRVVLLDEPFAGIDPIAVGEIKSFIRAMRDRGIGVLLTDHNVRETLTICDRAYLISGGRILVAGTPADIVADEAAREAYLGRDFAL